MTRWAVVFTDRDEMLAVRSEKKLRDAHVAFAKAHSKLLIGGGLKPDVDAEFSGALWIVEAEKKSEVEQLIRADPFFFPEYRSYQIYTWGKILEGQTTVL